jgi:hypothetical protein
VISLITPSTTLPRLSVLSSSDELEITEFDLGFTKTSSGKTSNGVFFGNVVVDFEQYPETTAVTSLPIERDFKNSFGPL